MKTILIIGLISLLTVSCKTSFRISVQEPATINIPNGVNRLGIINNVNKENSPEQQIAGVILGTAQINGNVTAAERAVEGALRSFERSNFLEGVSLPQVKQIHNTDGTINWHLLDSIAQAETLDGFIELRTMETTSPVGGTVLANATGQNSIQLNGTMYVNVYFPERQISTPQYKVYHNYHIPTSGNLSIISILNDIQLKTEYFKALGFELGHKAAGLLYQNWVWVSRTYYSKGSKNIKRAKPMIAKGNWDIAEKQLLMEVSPKNEKVQRRTLYNLALVKEGQGHITKAIEYAEQAALLGDKMANEYLRTLQRRKAQLGI